MTRNRPDRIQLWRSKLWLEDIRKKKLYFRATSYIIYVELATPNVLKMLIYTHNVKGGVKHIRNLCEIELNCGRLWRWRTNFSWIKLQLTGDGLFC